MERFKICSRCKKSLPLSNFNKDKTRRDKHTYYCKICAAEKFERWRKRNMSRRRDTHTQWRNELRLKVLNYLSNNIPHCSLCGFSDVRILQVDHIKGGGSREKKEIGGNLSTIYSKILNMNQEDAKKGYQILCPNCNWIKKIESENERGGLKPFNLPR